MKIICHLLLLAGSFSSAFSQQQLRNVYLVNNINPPVQAIQTNVLVNTGNTDNNNSDDDHNPVQQQYSNYMNNAENIDQIQQSSNKEKQSSEVVSHAKGVNLLLNFSFRSASSRLASGKTNKHAFQKKWKKFNRNFYGKLTSHKKSKHLVDVCFNWSK